MAGECLAELAALYRKFGNRTEEIPQRSPMVLMNLLQVALTSTKHNKRLDAGASQKEKNAVPSPIRSRLFPRIV